MRDIETKIINTVEQIGDVVDWLVLVPENPFSYSPSMYIDLEGINLCREGSLSIFTLMADVGTRRVYLFDVHSLGALVFNTAGVKKKTLKDILEDDKISKVFFDARNDSDVLFAHFGVRLRGVEDVQLMESATRRTTKSRKFLSGLAKCVEENLIACMWRIGPNQENWKLAKAKGEQLFKAEHGGSYEVFNQRPIPEEIISYCVGDVCYLPELRDRFWSNRAYRWQDLVTEETKKRVAASQEPDYQPNGPDRAVAPWNDDQNETLDQWNYVPPRRDYFDEDWLGEDRFDDGWSDYQDDDNDFEDWTRAPWQGPPS